MKTLSALFALMLLASCAPAPPPTPADTGEGFFNHMTMATDGSLAEVGGSVKLTTLTFYYGNTTLHAPDVANIATFLEQKYNAVAVLYDQYHALFHVILDGVIQK